MFVTRSYDTLGKEEWHYAAPADMGDEEYSDEISFLDRDGNPALARHYSVDESWGVWWDQDIFDDFYPTTLTSNLTDQVLTSPVEGEVSYVSTLFKRLRARDGSIIQTYFGKSFAHKGVWMVWN